MVVDGEQPAPVVAEPEHVHEEDTEPDMWEETFKTHTDTKPNGTTHFFARCKNN